MWWINRWTSNPRIPPAHYAGIIGFASRITGGFIGIEICCWNRKHWLILLIPLPHAVAIAAGIRASTLSRSRFRNEDGCFANRQICWRMKLDNDCLRTKSPGHCCCTCRYHFQDFNDDTTESDRRSIDARCVCGDPKGWVCALGISDGILRSGWTEHGLCGEWHSFGYPIDELEYAKSEKIKSMQKWNDGLRNEIIRLNMRIWGRKKSRIRKGYEGKVCFVMSRVHAALSTRVGDRYRDELSA